VRRRHDDAAKYTAYVLWLIGHSEGTIAKALSLRRKQIAGMIGRSEYANRSAMTDADRTEKLKELQNVRFYEGVPVDGGLLDRIEFRIIPAGLVASNGALRRKM
jgi:hypothetical protein